METGTIVTAFIFGMAAGGLLTLIFLKATLIYAHSQLEKGERQWNENIAVLKNATDQKEQVIEMQKDMILFARQIQQRLDEAGVNVKIMNTPATMH